MSVVTNIVFSFSILEDDYNDGDDYYLLDEINKWLIKHNYGTFGKDVDTISGGTKHLDTPLYAAAFNYFNVNKFIDFLKTLKWKEPESVQVFIQEQEKDKFTLIEILP